MSVTVTHEEARWFAPWPVPPGSEVPVAAQAARCVVAKRTLDVVVAAALLLVLGPLLLAVAVAVRLSSPGPVLFRQRRVGRGGVEFDIVKFRTMRADAERQLSSRPDLHAAYLAGGYKLAPGADPRITAVGRLLRRVDLDEVPQLWNVVKGDMSLVGPRPVPDAELALYGEARRSYEAVRPGMTGLWQVSGRNRVNHARRVALDVDYVRRLSVARDLAILARTLPAVVRGGGVPGSGAGPTTSESLVDGREDAAHVVTRAG